MKTNINILLITTYSQEIVNEVSPSMNDHLAEYLVKNCSEDLDRQREVLGKQSKTDESVQISQKPEWAEKIYNIIEDKKIVDKEIKKPYQNDDWSTFVDVLSKKFDNEGNRDLYKEIEPLIEQYHNDHSSEKNQEEKRRDESLITIEDLKNHRSVEAININQAAKKIGSTYEHRLGVYNIKEDAIHVNEDTIEKYIFLAVLPLENPCVLDNINTCPWVSTLTEVALDFCKQEDNLNLILLLHGKDLGKDEEFHTISYSEKISKNVSPKSEIAEAHQDVEEDSNHGDDHRDDGTSCDILRSITLFQHNQNDKYNSIKEEVVNGSAKSIFDKTQELIKFDWDSKQPFKKGVIPRKYKIWLQQTEIERHYNYFFDETVDNNDALRKLLLDRLDGNDTNYFTEVDKCESGFKPIHIVTYNPSDLFHGQTYIKNQTAPFSQELFECKKEEDIEKKQYVPIIHLCNSDQFVNTLYGISSVPYYFPRSFMIMDSSIWNYLVPLTAIPYFKELAINPNKLSGVEHELNASIEIEYYLFENFLRVIGSIYQNYESNLYNLTVAKEYADLSARVVKQSYLSGTHAVGVSPYIFHSEHATAQLIRREFFDNSRLEIIKKNNKWRFLLVDDKSQEFKLSIIEKDLKKIFNVVSCKFGESSPCYDDCDIVIEYVEKLEDAEKALKQKRYDIVLLDYFLKQPEGFHYGYELLEDVYRDQKEHENDEEHLEYKMAPHRHLRLYCMFISAYSSAVHDRLLAEGLNQSEKYWYISLGACPTNTPQLFLYNLIKLMEKRLEDSHMNRLSIDSIMDDLNLIFGEEGKERTNASKQYYKIQSYQYYFRSLLKDYDITVGNKNNLFKTDKSVLITHFLNDRINMGGLLEHLAHLVHLTGFGTIRQWPEMWEEYLYVKVQLESLTKVKDEKQKCKKLCRHIENYIKNLKSPLYELR